MGPTIPSTCGAMRPTHWERGSRMRLRLYGWCAAIRGVEGGGLVEGLPCHTFRTDEGDVALKCPTEIAITDRREKELADLRLYSVGTLQGHRLRGVLQRPVASESQALR